MASMTFALHVELEDGKTFDVTADQRDVAAWEVAPFGTPADQMGTRIHSTLRYLAWNALRRKGLTPLGWDEFNDLCVEVRDGSAEDGNSPLDPGPKAPSDES